MMDANPDIAVVAALVISTVALIVTIGHFGNLILKAIESLKEER